MQIKHYDTLKELFGADKTNGTSTSKGTKRKSPMNDFLEAQYEKVTLRITTIANAVKEGNYCSSKLHDVAHRQVELVERQAFVAERQVSVAEKQVSLIERQVAIAEKYDSSYAYDDDSDYEKLLFLKL
ncbi:hypothetical protein HN51_013043, partial [Arachis hypogaea]